MNEVLKLEIENMIEEYKLLSDSLVEINKLYEEIKDEKNNKFAGTRSTPNFVAQQNGTLNSVMNSKITIITKMSDIKRNMQELRIKEFNANKSLENGDSGDSAALLKLMDTIFGMSDDEIENKTQKAKEKITKEDIMDNKSSAEDLIDAFIKNDNGEEDIKEETVSDKNKKYEELQSLLNKHKIDIYYDIVSESFVFISNSEVDSGELIEKDYLKKVEPTILDLIDSIKIEEIDEENEIVKTSLVNIPLVSIN